MSIMSIHVNFDLKSGLLFLGSYNPRKTNIPKPIIWKTNANKITNFISVGSLRNQSGENSSRTFSNSVAIVISI